MLKATSNKLNVIVKEEQKPFLVQGHECKFRTYTLCYQSIMQIYQTNNKLCVFTAPVSGPPNTELRNNALLLRYYKTLAECESNTGVKK